MNAAQIEREWLRGCSCSRAGRPWDCIDCTKGMLRAMRSADNNGARFYVWKRGGQACSWWLSVPPDFPCVDATDMDDAEFEALIREIEAL